MSPTLRLGGFNRSMCYFKVKNEDVDSWFCVTEVFCWTKTVLGLSIFSSESRLSVFSVQFFFTIPFMCLLELVCEGPTNLKLYIVYFQGPAALQ